MAAFFCIHSWQALFGQRLVMGIFSGITATALGTIIACIVPARHQGLGIGIFSSSTVLALAFGPFLGMLLMPVCSYGNMVGASVIIAGMCVPCALFVKNFAEPCKWHRPAFKLNSYIDTRVALFSISALLFCPSYGCVQVFMQGFAIERGVGTSASLFFICYALAALATRPIIGRLYDKFGPSLILPPLFLLAICALFLISAAKSPYMLWLAGILFGMGFGNYQSVGQSIAISEVTKSRFAQATTTFFIFFDLGVGIGPYIFGYMVTLAGYASMFVSLAAMVFCGMIFVMLEEKRKSRIAI